MKVTVVFFAICRDLAGTGRIDLELPDIVPVKYLTNTIKQRFPGLEPLMSQVAVAVNNTYVHESYILHDGDAVSLIPPVSGG